MNPQSEQSALIHTSKSPAGHWKCVVDTWNDNPMERALPPG